MVLVADGTAWRCGVGDRPPPARHKHEIASSRIRREGINRGRRMVIEGRWIAMTTDNVTVSGIPACYVTGTRITTETAEVPVEALAIGDPVRLHGGGVAPVVWIGHRRVDCSLH